MPLGQQGSAPAHMIVLDQQKTASGNAGQVHGKDLAAGTNASLFVVKQLDIQRTDGKILGGCHKGNNYNEMNDGLKLLPDIKKSHADDQQTVCHARPQRLLLVMIFLQSLHVQ